MRKSPRSGGPKTEAGKTRTSLNAMTHGLSTARAMPDEVQRVRDFVTELASHYRPQSPLELLQIERIAVCRAKLAKLFEIEVAGRQLRQHDIEQRPSLVFDRLQINDPCVRAMAERALGGHSPVPSELGVQQTDLEQFAREIRSVGNRLLNAPEELRRCLPKLCKFLDGWPGGRSPEARNSGDQLHRFSARISSWKSSFAERPQVVSEVDALLAQINRDHSDHRSSGRGEHEPSVDSAAYHQVVMRELREIEGLHHMVSQIPDVLGRFKQMKAWLLSAADLQVEDADRLMRYQTALERRLSTAIGELLELQRHHSTAPQAK